MFLYLLANITGMTHFNRQRPTNEMGFPNRLFYVLGSMLILGKFTYEHSSLSLNFRMIVKYQMAKDVETNSIR